MKRRISTGSTVHSVSMTVLCAVWVATGCALARKRQQTYARSAVTNRTTSVMIHRIWLCRSCSRSATGVAGSCRPICQGTGRSANAAPGNSAKVADPIISSSSRWIDRVERFIFCLSADKEFQPPVLTAALEGHCPRLREPAKCNGHVPVGIHRDRRSSVCPSLVSLSIGCNVEGRCRASLHSGGARTPWRGRFMADPASAGKLSYRRISSRVTRSAGYGPLGPEDRPSRVRDLQPLDPTDSGSSLRRRLQQLNSVADFQAEAQFGERGPGREAPRRQRSPEPGTRQSPAPRHAAPGRLVIVEIEFDAMFRLGRRMGRDDVPGVGLLLQRADHFLQPDTG